MAQGLPTVSPVAASKTQALMDSVPPSTPMTRLRPDDGDAVARKGTHVIRSRRREAEEVIDVILLE